MEARERTFKELQWTFKTVNQSSAFSFISAEISSDVAHLFSRDRSISLVNNSCQWWYSWITIDLISKPWFNYVCKIELCDVKVALVNDFQYEKYVQCSSKHID